MLSAVIAQTSEPQAEKKLEWACQGSHFIDEKITVLGKALYHCDPAEEIQLDTNVYKGYFWQRSGIYPRAQEQL